jgi:hypothetical protein
MRGAGMEPTAAQRAVDENTAEHKPHASAPEDGPSIIAQPLGCAIQRAKKRGAPRGCADAPLLTAVTAASAGCSPAGRFARRPAARRACGWSGICVLGRSRRPERRLPWPLVEDATLRLRATEQSRTARRGARAAPEPLCEPTADSRTTLKPNSFKSGADHGVHESGGTPIAGPVATTRSLFSLGGSAAVALLQQR